MRCGLRFYPHIYNTDAHIDRAIVDVKQALSTIFRSNWR